MSGDKGIVSGDKGLQGDTGLQVSNETTVKTEKLKQLINNFFEVCALADEVNIYEFEAGDALMQEMKEWVAENFKEYR